MNKELGRKVLDHVTAHREQFDMGTYGSDRECGTVACLAGWAMLLSPGYTISNAEPWLVFIRPDGSKVGNEDAEARRLLWLTDDEYHGTGDEEPLFDSGQMEDDAIARFRALVEAAEAAAS